MASAPLQIREISASDPVSSDQAQLVVGRGRSYGDVCLNNGGELLTTFSQQKILSFDTTNGIISVEAGIDLHTLNSAVIPHGWLVRVLPGTSQITVGGAIANDIHGKNHFAEGTFGTHVRSLVLRRSDGSRLNCSSDTNMAFFNATIGGLGLTGVIESAELQLLRISSSVIDAISIKTGSLQETLDVLSDADRNNQYSVAWVDMLGARSSWGRGHVLVGDHAGAENGLPLPKPPATSSMIPGIGKVLMSTSTLRLANTLRYHRQTKRVASMKISHVDFFHPLDGVAHWNHAYGDRGFFQYQFVVPEDEAGLYAMNGILDDLHRAGIPPYLVVVKKFGAVRSPGVLSFPTEGITFAIDIPNQGQQVLDTLSRCDARLLECGGRVYPAKDARMSARDFQRMYPDWTILEQVRDPAFMSTFWKRVAGT